MIDVVLCEELRSFVGKITTVRLNGLLAGGEEGVKKRERV